MRQLRNVALGAAALLAIAAVGAPAQARVSIGIGLGGYPGYYGPGYYGPPGRVVCDPYSRWYDPYRCDAYYADYYYGPVFIDGVWINGPVRWRDFGGRREFFWRGSWREGRGWRGSGRH
jgi:hypothetical protein